MGLQKRKVYVTNWDDSVGITTGWTGSFLFSTESFNLLPLQLNLICSVPMFLKRTTEGGKEPTCQIYDFTFHCADSSQHFILNTMIKHKKELIKQLMVRQRNNSSSPHLMLLPQHVSVIRPSSGGIQQ
jgi:hypothetical protein